jgi:amidophosphoribosyltransferase
VGEIRDYLGADSLAYLELDALKEATGASGAGFCDACLTGQYPTEVAVAFRREPHVGSPVG